MAAPCIRIRPYRNADYPRLCAIHDAARRNELALAGLSDAFLPLEVAAGRKGLFDYTLRLAELDGQTAGFAAFTQDAVCGPRPGPPGGGPGPGGVRPERDGPAGVHRGARRQRPRPGPL